MPPPSAPQKPAPTATGAAPAKKDKGGPNPMLAIIGLALIVFAGGYAAYKIATAPPEKKVIRKH